MSHEVTSNIQYTKTENLIQEFVTRGVVVLSPESLRIPTDIHQKIYEKEKKVLHDQLRITPDLIPEILKILNAPGLVDACDRILGKDWAVVPFTHNAPFISGAFDQHWHKDDNAPYNGRKQRHHQSIQLEMLYYPQEVTEMMGPTKIIPFTQYWTFNHEENQDNFAGADHLDFSYLIEGLEKIPVSGPDSKYDLLDIVKRQTYHDIRMEKAVSQLNWPLVSSFELAPLRAGSVVLYSHNIFHRGNHRRDDWKQWQNKPRFMWRFWLYRTNEPYGKPSEEVDWTKQEKDPLTKIEISSFSDETYCIWNFHKLWMESGNFLCKKSKTYMYSVKTKKNIYEHLFKKMLKKGDENEPIRIGAAYKLATLEDITLAKNLLRKALFYDRENVRRAATYGLITLGQESTEIFLEAILSPIKWIRKAGIFGLGEVSHLNQEVLNHLKSCLLKDSSTYIRSVAAGSIGCLVRRAVAHKNGLLWVDDCVHALIESLNIEHNRLSMDLAQQRDIKFVRPTDECDVCEGLGVDFGFKNFKPERSAVRENSLWALVIICSHGEALTEETIEVVIKKLKKVVLEDKNVINVGFAMDALSRILNLKQNTNVKSSLIQKNKDEFPSLILSSPIHCRESLIRSGYDYQSFQDISN